MPLPSTPAVVFKLHRCISSLSHTPSSVSSAAATCRSLLSLSESPLWPAYLPYGYIDDALLREKLQALGVTLAEAQSTAFQEPPADTFPSCKSSSREDKARRFPLPFPFARFVSQLSLHRRRPLTLLSFALVSIDEGSRHRRRIEPQDILLAVAAVE